MLDNESLEVVNKGILGEILVLEINGKRYSYKASPDSGMNIEEISQKFEILAKEASVGKALAWVKKNTDLVGGSVKGISPILRDTPADPKLKIVASRTKAQLLLDLINENDPEQGMKLINACVENVTSRIENLSNSYKVTLSPNIKEVKETIIDRANSMCKSVPPSGLIYNIMPSHEQMDNKDIFKEKFRETIQSYIAVLNNIRENHRWVDVKELVKPILAIKYQ